jgi:hypothetical protein
MTMLKLRHTTLIVISGLIWLAIGVYLLRLGLNFIIGGIHSDTASFVDYPLIHFLLPYSGGVEGAGIILIAISLLMGHAKGRYVLAKSARKGVQRILSFPNPTSLGNIYSAKYYILLGAMIALGVSVKYLGFASDIRGVVDVIIGSALINGAMFYFRMGQDIRKNQQQALG